MTACLRMFSSVTTRASPSRRTGSLKEANTHLLTKLSLENRTITSRHRPQLCPSMLAQEALVRILARSGVSKEDCWYSESLQCTKFSGRSMLEHCSYHVCFALYFCVWLLFDVVWNKCACTCNQARPITDHCCGNWQFISCWPSNHQGFMCCDFL